MKTALIPVLLTLGAIGLLATAPAMAQYGSSTPANTKPASFLSVSSQGQSDNQAPSTAAPMPPGDAAATPGTTPSPYPATRPTTNETATADTTPPSATGVAPLIDNGLWQSTSPAPCCPLCGGGNASPADWYTKQEVQVLYHSKPRGMDLAFRAPSGGLFAVEALDTVGDFQVVNQPTPSGGSIVSNNTNVTNPFEVFSSKDTGFAAAPGYNMTIGHYFCRDRNNNDHFVELTFWGLNSWSDFRTVGGYLVPTYDQTVIYNQGQANEINAGSLVPTIVPNEQVGSLRTPFPELSQMPAATPSQQTLSLAFNNGTNYDYSYRSTMNNFEINGRIVPRGEPDRLVLHPDGIWRAECQPGMYMSYLYGLRLMQVDETFTFHSQSQGFFTPNPLLPANIVQYLGGGDYDVVTHNTLLGLQIGADMTFRACRWTWGINAKLGPYINFGSQDSSIDGQAAGTGLPIVNEQLAGNRANIALIGQVGFEASYKFRPNLVGHAGWNFMWINGLALAPNKSSSPTPPSTRSTPTAPSSRRAFRWAWSGCGSRSTPVGSQRRFSCRSVARCAFALLS